MAPSSLHGLNLVHPPHAPSSSQDLLNGPPFPDSLWTNNNFVFDDEPLVDEKYAKRNTRDSDEELELDANRHVDSVLRQGHVNVVTGTNVGDALPQQPFDINSFLANHLGQSQNSTVSPSLDQSSQSPYDYPPAKRARTRKPSISASAADSPEDNTAALAVSVAEDKRRRNTAASARFRLKKKEREAALETKAKELEGRVNELERECEALRRENGWLKGLVVGVTSGNVQQQQNFPADIGLPDIAEAKSRR
ncbi:BZIP domain-containing protein [Mycena sanguinolenta]|uniref:BZIP domain-containing protein n=1 Tax=Mycena sanguinolenta TaxID=230812 RepID=A0A8H6YGN5_9AGAR|nr:BZIP domain-containing protein [Mycena sanguinolenta]